MSFKIVVDSCCDLTDEELASPCYSWVPLTLRVGDFTCEDDETFDQVDFIRRMKKCATAASTACPSPLAYAEAYDCGVEDVYVVTLSALLSGSHNSAVRGQAMFQEAHPDVRVHVFNSCSAVCGEAIIAMKIRELAESGQHFSQIVAQVEQYISKLRTLFVLESLENLRKNGRLTKVQALITGTLHIKLLMGSTPTGEIRKLGQGISINQTLSKMVDLIVKDPEHVGKVVGLSHTNNPERAEYVRKMLEKRCQFSKIIVSGTHGVSTIYSEDGGIVVAY